MPDVSLKDYIDQRFADKDRAIEQRFTDASASISVARNSMDKRLEGMNEFRDSIRDMSGKYATRAEVLAFIVAITSLVVGVFHILGRWAG